MKTKYSFSFPIPMYQTPPKCNLFNIKNKNN